MNNEIVFSSFDVSAVMTGFAGYFKTRISDEKTAAHVIVPSGYGTGDIKVMDFKDGLSMLVFNCHLKRDLIIKYKCEENQPLRLIFCVENDMKHVIKGDRMQYQLTCLLGSMVSGSCKEEQMFLIPAEKPVYFYCIEINRKMYNNKITHTLGSLPAELADVFNDVDGTRPFLYQGHYSLTIAQCIQNIHKNTYSGLVQQIYLESQTLEIMAMQIKQYLDDLTPSRKQSVLRKKDMELIIEARNRLLADLIKPPTIKELAMLTGTNENKLKKGFRLLYNTSINKLLQNERLSKAKLLIAEQAYPIKEIARMVGYKHSGHFTAKFKKKFGMLPKEYIKSMVQR
jgi:AraC family transcriptional regulator, transcriptional activator of the genes for pyochelin and ferripyochelin receptors